MKKLYLFGAYRDDTSLGIYTQRLIEQFEKKYQIIDRRRNNTLLENYEKSNALTPKQNILQNIRELPDTMISRKFDKNNILLSPHTANIIPILFLFSKAKTVHIVHDLFAYDDDFCGSKSTVNCFFLKMYFRWFHKFLSRQAFRKADHIIAISEATKKEIIDKFGKHLEKKIEVIYNGIDHSIFQNTHKKPRLKSIPDKKYILYIGSELPRKNLKNILGAFAQFQKSHPEYILVKAPIEKWKEHRDKTLQYLEENNLKLGKDVIILDTYLPIEDIVSLYQNAELFLFPTLKEGFGFPILEGQACGTPVITTNYEPMSELVPYKNLLVDPGNPNDIAKKMSEALKNTETREKYIQMGLEFIKKFTWEEVGNKFIKVFETKK